MTSDPIAHREATRHVAAYLLHPNRPRPMLRVDSEPSLGTELAAELQVDPVEADALATREATAIRALERALVESGTLASEEADLIVDVARGDATPADLRHYRAITEQSRCGLDG
jgi:hypothetical protein